LTNKVLQDTPQGASMLTTGDELVSLKSVAQTLKKRIWLIVLVMILMVGLAVGSGFLESPQYESSITILVGQRSDANPTYSPTILDLQQLTLTMAQAVESRRVAEAAIRRLDLSTTPESLVANLDSKAEQETQFITVTYTDSDPQRAQRVVNVIGEEFSEQVRKVSLSTNAVTATVWEKATVPEAPVSPNFVRRALVASVMGVMLGLGLVLLLEVTDDRWHSPVEAEQISGVPTLGIIPGFGRAKI
jgi:capsular polysaccharide biosynthesis protein